MNEEIMAIRGLRSSVVRTPFKENLFSRAQWHLYGASLILSDVVMSAFAFWLSFYLRFEANIPIFDIDIQPSFAFYRTVSIYISLLLITIFALSGLYRRKYLLGGTQEYEKLFRSVSLGILFIIVAGFLEPGFILARGWLLMTWVLTFFLVSIGRFFLRRMVYWMREAGYFLVPAVIVGANEEGESLVQQFLSWKRSGLHIVGVVGKGLKIGSKWVRDIPALGDLEQLPDLVTQFGVKELVLATSALTHEEMLAIFKRYGSIRGVNLRFSSGLFEIITTGLEIKEIASVPLVQINKVRLIGINLFMKRALDYLITLPAVVLLVSGWPCYRFMGQAGIQWAYYPSQACNGCKWYELRCI